MNARTRKYLADVLDACDYIASKVDGIDQSRYLADRDLRAMVERYLITIGEALTRVRDEEAEVLVRITDYRRAIGLRNVLAHDYDQVNDAQIWEVTTRFLPIVVREVTALLEEPE